MNKRNLLLAALITVSGMSVSEAQENNEEIVIYNDSKPGLILGITLTGIGVALNISSIRNKVPAIFYKDINWYRIAFPAVGSIMAAVFFLEHWNHQPYLTLRNEGFICEKVFYPWHDVEKLRECEYSNRFYMKEYLKVILKNKKEVEIQLSDKSEYPRKIIKLMERFYQSSKNKQ